MAERLFDMGFDGGVTRSQAFKEDGKIILSEEMPGSVVQAILDENHELRESNPLSKTRRDGLGVVGARIPITTHYKWKQEWRATGRKWGQPWHKFLKAKLNSPDYAKFRFMKL